jgi:hypothetical protein
MKNLPRDSYELYLQIAEQDSLAMLKEAQVLAYEKKR